MIKCVNTLQMPVTLCLLLNLKKTFRMIPGLNEHVKELHGTNMLNQSHGEKPINLEIPTFIYREMDG